VAQVVVLGDSRKFIGALIIPNFVALEAYAHERGLGFNSREELVAHASVCGFLQQEVDQACSHLPPHERIRQIVVLAREFTIAGGELSPSLKVKRPVVEERYREQIEEMFSRRPPGAPARQEAAGTGASG
jgi:long-chain acyl-CoA synthetase